MKGWTELGAGGRWAVGGIAVAVIALIGYVLLPGHEAPQVPAPPAPGAQSATATAGGGAAGGGTGTQTGTQTGAQTGGQAAAPATGATEKQAPDRAAKTAADQGADQAAAPPAGGATAAGGSDTGAATAAAEPGEPAFDVVRISPDGSALVAGRAAAGATVDVMIGGQKVASASAGPDGKFVALFDLPASDKPRVATLKSEGADGKAVDSSQSVIIAPAETAVASAGTGTAPADAGGGAGGGTATGAGAATGAAAQATAGTAASGTGAQTQTAATAPEATGGQTAAPVVAETPATPGTPEVAAGGTTVAAAGPAVPAAPSTDRPVAAADGIAAAPGPGKAPTVLLAGKSGVEVLQGQPDLPMGVDSIAYSETGAVELSGHGSANAHVRIYLDNKDVATAKVGADGRWSLALPGVHEGLYSLRADEIGAGGKVTARFETPFKRESEAALAKAGVTQGAGAGGQVGVRATIITVQPGYTLWGIAKASYGHGMLYVKVFDANREQIRDPDLIYPGQVFSVPGSK